MTLRKLGNTGNWKRKCSMAISVEYAVEDTMDGRKTGYVMMTITRQQAGKLRNSDSIPGISKAVLSTPKRPDGQYAPLCRLSRGTGRSFCCSKTAGTWRFLLLSNLRMNLFVLPNTVCLNAVKENCTFITMTPEIPLTA
jgi:hypothetical protein